MSNYANTLLYERAAEMIDFWTGTPWADAIEAATNRGNLDNLHIVVCDAEAEAARQEIHGFNEATDVY